MKITAKTYRDGRRFIAKGWDGRFWYRDAKEAIDTSGYNPSRFAAVLSIVSPRVHVRRSVALARRYMEEGELGPDVMRSVRLALAHYEQTSEIRGPKTEPFARALLGDEEAVVLDVWMAKAFDVDPGTIGRKYNIVPAVKAVRRLAAEHGITPAQCQAAIWTGIRREHGRSGGSLAEYL